MQILPIMCKPGVKIQCLIDGHLTECTNPAYQRLTWNLMCDDEPKHLNGCNFEVDHVSLQWGLTTNVIKATEDKDCQLAVGLVDVVCDHLADRGGDTTADFDKL